jgi:hypothetical protein
MWNYYVFGVEIAELFCVTLSKNSQHPPLPCHSPAQAIILTDH